MSFYPPRRNGMRTSAIGEKTRVRVQSEADQARVLEGTDKRLGLFSLHRVDWLHFANVEYTRGTLKSGWPDYFIVGDSWAAALEIKARSTATGRMGKLSDAQRNFHSKLTAAGVEVWTAYLPDDLGRINDWLRSKTGRVVNIDSLLSPAPGGEA